jgi:hypothetical protein
MKRTNLEEIEAHRQYHDQYYSKSIPNIVVAEKLGVTPATICNWKKEERNHTGLWAWEKVAALLEYLEQTKAQGGIVASVDDLRQRFGLCSSQIVGIVKHVGLHINDLNIINMHKIHSERRTAVRKELADKIRSIEGYENKSASELSRLISQNINLTIRVMREAGIVTGGKCVELDCLNFAPFTRAGAGRCQACISKRGKKLTAKESYRRKTRIRLEEEAMVVKEIRKAMTVEDKSETTAPVPEKSVELETDVSGPGCGFSASDMYVITNDVRFRIEALRKLAVTSNEIADELEMKTLQSFQTSVSEPVPERRVRTRADILKMLKDRNGSVPDPATTVLATA